VLTVILDEPGRYVLLGLEGVALVSAVNFTEVRSTLWDKGYSEKAIDEALAGIDITVVSFDAEQARLAADLRRQMRRFGLSLGDRACLALGILKARLFIRQTGFGPMSICPSR
jgi:ribonuclease VapC